MIEGRGSFGYAFVGKDFDEGDHCSDTCRVIPQFADAIHIRVKVMDVCMIEVRPANLELKNFFERLHATGVHIGPGELNVTQC